MAISLDYKWWGGGNSELTSILSVGLIYWGLVWKLVGHGNEIIYWRP
jgi:hypothetical protein